MTGCCYPHGHFNRNLRGSDGLNHCGGRRQRPCSGGVKEDEGVSMADGVGRGRDRDARTQAIDKGGRTTQNP
jgi:hypothetical protein